MRKYKRCDELVATMTRELLKEFETHAPVLKAGVSIDLVFAFAGRDQNGNKTAPALTLHGVEALGICKKIATKERALGRGDVEISLDGDWWNAAGTLERRALLDHELHHIAVVEDEETGEVVRDYLGRPEIEMRKHDYDIGWFKVIAERHGVNSQERKQAAAMMCDAGQYFWPALAPKLEKPDGKPAKETAKALPATLPPEKPRETGTETVPKPAGETPAPQQPAAPAAAAAPGGRKRKASEPKFEAPKWEKPA